MDSGSSISGISTPGVTKVIRLFAVQTFITTLLLTPTPLREPLLRNFALLPSATLAQSKIWNVFTAPYLESQPIRGLINTILLLLLSQRSFAPWTARQLLACVTIVNIIAACSTCISMLAAYVATRTSALIFTPIATTSGVCVTLLIVFKQLYPDLSVGFSNITMKSSYFPMSYLTVLLILTLLKLSPFGVLFFTGCALHIAWLYLRVFKISEDGTYGDESDSFAYVTLFPHALRPIIGPVVHLTYMTWVPLLRRWQSGDEADSLPVIQASVSKGSDRDAERRRQRAVRVLDEKLKADAASEAEGSAD